VEWLRGSTLLHAARRKVTHATAAILHETAVARHAKLRGRRRREVTAFPSGAFPLEWATVVRVLPGNLAARSVQRGRGTARPSRHPNRETDHGTLRQQHPPERGRDDLPVVPPAGRRGRAERREDRRPHRSSRPGRRRPRDHDVQRDEGRARDPDRRRAQGLSRRHREGVRLRRAKHRREDARRRRRGARPAHRPDHPRGEPGAGRYGRPGRGQRARAGVQDGLRPRGRRRGIVAWKPDGGQRLQTGPRADPGRGPEAPSRPTSRS